MKFWVGAVLAFVLSACSQQNIDQKTNAQRAGNPPERGTEFARDRQRIPNFDQALTMDVLRYDLKGTFDWTNLRLTATVDITLKLLDPRATELTINSAVEKVSRVVTGQGKLLGYRTTPDRKLIVDLSSVSAKAREGEMTVQVQYETGANSLASGEPSGLSAVPARAGDPVASHVAYSVSEPIAAEEWMPCHNDPRDRALFSAEFTMAETDTLISNGDLVMNEVDGHTRRMRYSTRYSLPPYLMAFAVGEFSTASLNHGALPISVWTRKGLPIDSEGVLKELDRQIGVYEKLLIPYPFEKYSIVLLPEFPAGGVEHAGITFQGETVSTESRIIHDIGLMAHELGHQWFGDYVTVKTWDDLWIKEGMASLLSEEGTRLYEDQNHSGRYHANNFVVSGDSSIVDPALAPDLKYTDGPYGRAAWLLTQIRVSVGEEKFWESLRLVLKRYSFGFIGTEEFIEVFKRDLGPVAFEKVRKALYVKKLPSLKVESGQDGFSVALADPDATLIQPIEMRWYDESGAYTSLNLKDGSKESLSGKDGRMLVLDPKDIHPVKNWISGDGAAKGLYPRLVPFSDKFKDLFKTFAPSTQILSLHWEGPEAVRNWELVPGKVTEFLSRFGSDEARYLALQSACEMAKPAEADAWKPEISRAVMQPPYFGFYPRAIGSGLAACAPYVKENVFDADWTAIETAPELATQSEHHLAYLALMDLEPDRAFPVWSALAERGGSVRGRRTGYQALAKYLGKSTAFTKLTEDQATRWKAFLRNVIATSEVTEILEPVLQDLVRADDKEALPAIAQALHRLVRPAAQKSLICAADDLASGAEEWKKFLNEVGEIKGLSPKAQTALGNPKSLCGENLAH